MDRETCALIKLNDREGNVVCTYLDLDLGVLYILIGGKLLVMPI